MAAVPRTLMMIAAVLGCGTLPVAGCKTPGSDGPAVLDGDEAGVRISLTAAAGALLGRPRIELGPGPVVGTTQITVLPPPPGPLETHSLARPELLAIERRAGICTLVRTATGETRPITGVTCRASGPSTAR